MECYAGGKRASGLRDQSGGTELKKFRIRTMCEVCPQLIKIPYRFAQRARFLALKDAAAKDLKRWNAKKIQDSCYATAGIAKK